MDFEKTTLQRPPKVEQSENITECYITLCIKKAFN